MSGNIRGTEHLDASPKTGHLAVVASADSTNASTTISASRERGACDQGVEDDLARQLARARKPCAARGDDFRACSKDKQRGSDENQERRQERLPRHGAMMERGEERGNALFPCALSQKS